jgi:hypothetical protein
MALQMTAEFDDLRALDAAGQEPEVEVHPSPPGNRPKVLPMKAVQEQRRLAPGRLWSARAAASGSGRLASALRRGPAGKSLRPLAISLRSVRR